MQVEKIYTFVSHQFEQRQACIRCKLSLIPPVLQGMAGKGQSVVPQIEEMLFGLHEVVFAKCQNFKPWPAQIIKISVGRLRNSNKDQYIYQVKYFGSDCFSDHCTSELQKFNQSTRIKYQLLYKNTKNKEEKLILKSMRMAQQRQQQNQAILKASISDPLLLTGLVPIQGKTQNFKQTKRERVNQKQPQPLFNQQQSRKRTADTDYDSKLLDQQGDGKSEHNLMSKENHSNSGPLIAGLANKTRPIVKGISQKTKKKKSKLKREPIKELNSKKDAQVQLGTIEVNDKNEQKESYIINTCKDEDGPQSQLINLGLSSIHDSKNQSNNMANVLDNNQHQITLNTQLQNFKADYSEPTKLANLIPQEKQTSQKKQKQDTLSLHYEAKQVKIKSYEQNINQGEAVIDQLIDRVDLQEGKTIPNVQSIEVGEAQQDKEELIIDEQTGQAIRLNFGYSDHITRLESHIDELDIEDNNYLKLFKLFKVRKIGIQGRNPKQLLSIANKYLEKMTKQLSKENPTIILSMKQKQVLMAILSCECVDIRALLYQNTIIKMYQFVSEYQRHNLPAKKSYEIQYQFMRGKLRMYLAVLRRSLPIFRLSPQKLQQYKAMIKQFSVEKND